MPLSEPGYISNLASMELDRNIRLRTVRDENLKGIGINELSAYAPTEEGPKATTDVTIQVNGKKTLGSQM